MKKHFFPAITWDSGEGISDLHASTVTKTERDLYLSELELERVLANNNMLKQRLARLKNADVR